MKAGERAARWPMKRILTELTLDRLDEAMPGSPSGKTYGDAAIDALMYQAIRGNRSALKLVWFVALGPAPVRVGRVSEEIQIVATGGDNET